MSQLSLLPCARVRRRRRVIPDRYRLVEMEAAVHAIPKIHRGQHRHEYDFDCWCLPKLDMTAEIPVAIHQQEK